MSGNEKEYHFVCSFGCNCSVAYQLKYRGLRTDAYPFDWVYYKSEKAIYTIANNFKDGFKNYMLKENLKEMPVNKSHLGFVQYEDAFASFIWANHFKKNINDKDSDYEKVKAKFDKRFKRLLDSVNKSEKVLFVFTTDFVVGVEPFQYLIRELKNLYPEKIFDIKVNSFECENQETIKEDNIEIFRHTRKLNYYDYTKTNNEWSFLDDIKLRGKRENKFSLKIGKLKLKAEWGV